MIDWVTTTTLNEDIEIIYEYIYQESVVVEEVIQTEYKLAYLAKKVAKIFFYVGKIEQIYSINQKN